MSGVTRLIVLVSLIVVVSAMSSSPTKETSKNHDLMKKLGLSRRHPAPNHHRKRLASESRGSNADSHMFVIKLPPNPYYYSHFKPNSGPNKLKKLQMGFKSNGKPGKIYHWNLPTLNKMADSRRYTSRRNDVVSNDVTPLKVVHVEKPTSLMHGYMTRKVTRLEKPAVSYYVPVPPVQKTRINKYFNGNGKPHSFYVIEKSKKPAKYHRLLT